jgi:hypothetical protein
MTQAAETLTPPTGAETRLVTSISAAHFVSHYYILLLPPLFNFVRADYGVSYTELGFALVAFNVVSAALQTPAALNAVTDALFRAYGIRHIDMPTTPSRIWAAIRNAKVK